MKRSRSVQQQPPLPTTKAWPRGESWVSERKSCSCLCSDCWCWVPSSCTRCWDTWHGLKLGSKRQAAASSLNLRRNSMLRTTRVSLMRALASVGVFSHVRGDRFALSRRAESLQTGVHGSLKATVITLGEIHYQECGNLLHSVQTGSPAFNHVFGASLFDYLKQNTDAADTFNQGMTNLSSMLAYAVLTAYDFARISSIVDIGGGKGKLLRKILELNQEMIGAVLDMPRTIETVNQEPHANGRAGRCSYIAGDFFDSVPEGADAYLLCGVIHDWADDRACTILRNCRRAMARNGRLLQVEMVVPDTDVACFSKLLDLNMLVMTGGRERTEAEFCTLLHASDYKLTKIIPTMAPQCVIEAVAN